MNIKDFTPGQKAYALVERSNMSFDGLQELVVVSVGRKYVKAATEGRKEWTTDYYSRFDDEEYLVENKDCGRPEKLFPTKQAAEDYQERVTLHQEIRAEIGRSGLHDYTLDQLRQIKRIMEGQA